VGIFSTPFFSIAGQKERLSNVGKTLYAAVTGQGVQSNTGIKTVDKALSAAASNPFTTAAVVTVAAAPLKTLSLAKSAFNALPATGKVAVVAAAPIVTSAVVSNPKIVTSAAKAPKELSRFGSDVGGLIKEPSVKKAKELLQESPLIVTALGVAGVAAVGPGIVSAIGTAKQAKATERVAESISNLPAAVGHNSPQETGLSPYASPAAASQVPLTPATQVMGREVSTTNGAQRRISRRKPPSKPQTQSVRLNILNQNFINGERRGQTQWA